MDFDGFREFARVRKSSQGDLVDFDGFRCILVDFNGFRWMSMGFEGGLEGTVREL